MLRRREQWRYLLLLAPAFIFLIVFYGYPVAAMLLRSFNDPAWGWQNFAPITQLKSTIDILGQSVPTNAYIHVFGITLQMAFVTTVFTLLLGYPVAYALSSLSASRANLLMILVLIPFWTSILVRSYAWMVLLGQEGIVNEALLASGLRTEPMQLLNTRFAVYVGMIHILLPFMILPLYAVMRGIDRNLLRAAENLGARSGSRLPAHLSAAQLAGGGGGMPARLHPWSRVLHHAGAPRRPEDIMVSMLIQQQISQLKWGFGAALALILLDRCAGHLPRLHPSARGGAGLRVGPGMTASSTPATLPRPVGRVAALLQAPRRPLSVGRILLWLIVALVLLYLVFPVFVVAPVSFSSAKYLQFPPPGWSLQWYQNYFERPGWVPATLLSIRVAVAVALLATILGTAASLALVRGRFPGRDAVNSFIVSPLIVPGIIVAIGIYFVYAQVKLVGNPLGLVSPTRRWRCRSW